MQQEIKEYLETQFLFRFDDEITEDTDLFKAGILDSFGYISMMAHLEERYSVHFGEDELLGDVMVSLTGIVRLVEAARAQHSTESR